MTKEQAIEMLTKYVADGEEIQISWWNRSDVQEWSEQDLTDEQWELFIRWYDKYQDSSYDLNEAVAYAVKYAGKEEE